MIEALAWLALSAGGFFFVAGTVGMLRFPDVYCRLHALTKADTLGLGLVVLGLSLMADNGQAVGIMVVIWLLVMASGATACQLLARYERERELTQEAKGNKGSLPEIDKTNPEARGQS